MVNCETKAREWRPIGAPNMGLPKLEPHRHDLPADVFGSTAVLLDELGRSEEPIAAMVTCWELACTPHQVSHATPGEIMVVQNPAGLVAAAGANGEVAISESIRYCLQQPTVRHLIVCGHTRCKTIAAILSDDAAGRLDTSCQIRACASRQFEELYANRPAGEWLGIIAQELVLLQLANLGGHAEIQSRLSSGTLHLHGWMRDDETSVVAAFDPASGQFTD
jgi:carbonic anhydrase